MPAAEPTYTWGSKTPLAARLEGDPRVRVVTPGTPGHQGDLVVYWPQIARRARSNAALSYAIAEANARRLPLLVYEALRVDYPFASDRFHTFVLEGARAEAALYRERGASYAFFLPRSKEEARGVLARLTARAALLVTDDFPTYLVPAHVAALGAKSACPVVAIDDNCVVPLSLLPKEEYAARTIRPKLHRLFGEWLRPLEENVVRKQVRSIALPFAELDVENVEIAEVVAGLPIDHDVPAVSDTRGGSAEAHARLERFLDRSLRRYPEEQRDPDAAATSALSGHLHFGMIGAREIALAVRDAAGDAGARDSFLEQLLVRRALAFNLAATNPRHASLDVLPDWAKATLAKHARDPRKVLVSREDLEAARSPDAVWNAAQRELRATGVVHNYIRMLWGKCVIPWKKTPVEAFDDLVYLNDKYALDGRDPNTYTNILWCFGKHDRAWGPERPIFGTVRYMSTDAAQRKLAMSDWLSRWSR